MYTLEYLNDINEDQFYMIVKYQLPYLDISEMSKEQLTLILTGE